MKTNKQFKYLNLQVAEIVEKLGKAAPTVTTMKDDELRKIYEAMNNTIDGIKQELNITSKALTEVNKAVEGEIARRQISLRVDNQISMFDQFDASKAIAKQEAPKIVEPATEDDIEDEEQDEE